MADLLEDFCDFLTHSPTSWHATREMGNRLASLDFTPLFYGEKWKLEKGGRYFVIHDGSLAAFVLPKKAPEQMAIVSSHTDSPALKLKPNPFYESHNMEVLGVEIYGSPVLPSWLNRDLGIAGRVTVLQKKGEIEEHTVFFDDAPILIPLLAPHLDRQAYKKGLELNQQDHITPILGLKDEQVDLSTVEGLLRRELSFQKLLGFDLFLVPLDPPRFIGVGGEMLASYRLDNLASAHAALTGIGNIEKPLETTLPMALFWDHEEVGSETSIGAQSPFFRDIYDRICSVYSVKKEDEILIRQNSLCLSVDLTHAANPAYLKKYDPQHIPLLGEGITVKYNAGMHYTTNARSGAFMTLLADKLKLKLQRFVNRSDNPAGSTVGPLFAAQMGIETVDIGIPQLSMHAAREVISCSDHIDMCHLLSAFLQGGA